MNVSAWLPDAFIILTLSLISVENLLDSTTAPQALHYFFAVDAMTGDFSVVEGGEDYLYASYKPLTRYLLFCPVGVNGRRHTLPERS